MVLSKLTEVVEFAQKQLLSLVVYHPNKVRTVRAETQTRPKSRTESPSLAALRENPLSFQWKSSSALLSSSLSSLLRSLRELLCVTAPESDGLLYLHWFPSDVSYDEGGRYPPDQPITKRLESDSNWRNFIHKNTAFYHPAHCDGERGEAVDQCGDWQSVMVLMGS